MLLRVSPHTHVESPISGSTVEGLIDQAVKLGRTHFAYTDPGYMASAYRGYKYATSKKLKFIPGLEIYFKDPDCPIVSGTKSNNARYFKLTLHAHDQTAFQALSELSSKESGQKIYSYGQEYYGTTWADLEQIARFNVSACSSDIHDMVSKNLLTKRPELSEKVLLKLKGIFGDKYRATIVGVEQTHIWMSLVEVALTNGRKVVLQTHDRTSTNASKFVLAKEIVERPNKHTSLISFVRNGVLEHCDSEIQSAKIHEGFLRIPNGDQQLIANKLMVALSKKHNIKLLYSDYAYYASPEDKTVQDVRLSQEGLKEHAKRHMQSSEEAAAYLAKLGLNNDQIKEIFEENDNWAKSFDGFSLKYDYSIPEVPNGENPLSLCLKIIKENGRLPTNKPEYFERLKYEIDVLAKNGVVDLTSYFLPIYDVLNFYKQNKRLTGPARGSAAGSLFMYLMGITQVDPIKYGLSFERFLSLDRVLTGNWPDVDVDLVNRDLLVGEDGQSGYLYGRWGDKAAQISTRIMLRLKSAIKDVNRHVNNGTVEPEIERLSNSLPVPPQGVDDKKFVFGYEDDGTHYPGLIEINRDLQMYAESRPKEWDIVLRCLGISRQYSKHASAFVIANKPIRQVVPTFMGNITQYDMKAVESAKLIKYDFLVVKQLEDIEKCILLINKKHGVNLEINQFIQNGNVMNVWDLPEDLAVYQSIWNGDTETIFQLLTQSMSPFVQKIKPKCMDDLSVILALNRPGPLDFIDEKTGRNMAEEYIARRNGLSQSDFPELAEILPETYGIQVYQEQVSKVSRILGNMKPTDAEELRRVFSKKDKDKSLKMKPLFMEGAVKKLGQEKAELLWGMMETFSRYGFNKSHSISYAMISYACMYLKHYYPLEWWAAILSNADEAEISTKLFKHVRELVVAPDINESNDEMTIDYANHKIRAKLTTMRGLGDKVAQPIINNRPYVDIKDFVAKKVAGDSLAKKLIHADIMNTLFPTGYTLLQKMQAYEDAKCQVDYESKVAAGKKTKLKQGKVDEEYLTLDPIGDFIKKKSILPTLPIDLTELVVRYSRKVDEGYGGQIKYSFGRSDLFTLVNGETGAKLEAKVFDRDVYFCLAGFVVDAKTFTYQKGKRKALKMMVDTDGQLTERVLWPDYDSGELIYPDNLKKGSVAIFYLKRRVGKPQSQILHIEVLKSID